MTWLRAGLVAVLLAAGLSAAEAPPPVTPETAPVVVAPATTPSATPAPAGGATPAAPPGLTISMSPGTTGGLSSALTVLLVITALAVAPAFLMMMTSFTRVIIVLGFVRRALGTQTLPPNQVMLGLALFLSLFIMAPTITRLNDQALQPYLADQINQKIALERASDAARDFMLKHTRKNDLALFIRMAKQERPKTAKDVSLLTLIPAFMTSEIKTAFQMGFVIFLPFLVIDLVVSAVLMALGMMMLPPAVVSLPFKILLFVLVDGWVLLLQGLVASYA
jgi:flagellar biosynthesis protein FliP